MPPTVLNIEATKVRRCIDNCCSTGTIAFGPRLHIQRPIYESAVMPSLLPMSNDARPQTTVGSARKTRQWQRMKGPLSLLLLGSVPAGQPRLPMPIHGGHEAPQPGTERPAALARKIILQRPLSELSILPPQHFWQRLLEYPETAISSKAPVFSLLRVDRVVQRSADGTTCRLPLTSTTCAA